MAERYEMTEMDVDLAPSLMKRGSNAALVASVIATREIAKQADINDPESLMHCLRQYMMFCLENNIKITNMAAYAACGVSSVDVSNWESGRTRANDGRYKEFAKFLRSVCSQYREQAMVEGLVNVAVGIFHQKVYDGFREDAPPADIADSGLEIKQDPEEIAAKYRDVITAEAEAEDE